TDAWFHDLLKDLHIEKMRDSVARERKWHTYDEWYDLENDVLRLKLSLEKIVKKARVSRDELWELYQLALSIQKRWVKWRREEAQRCWGKQSEESRQDFEEVLIAFGIPELEESWSRIIEGLRWLTSHTRATLQ